MLANLLTLSRSREFLMIALPFMVYVGFFNAFSSLINQILGPYSFSEDNSGIAGAILIVVGLITAAITSPIVDRHHVYLPYIRIATPMIAVCYLILLFAVPTRSIPFVFVICGLLGAASFGLVPVALEFLVEIHYPMGPEAGTTLCWCGGQLFGGIFIVVMDALKGGGGYRGDEAQGSMQRSLTFQAVVALLVMPAPVLVGLFGRGEYVRQRRWEVDRERREGEIRVEDAGEALERSETAEGGRGVEGRVMI
jgi:MFS transporter, FLVCR family, MFS-domain-containing protein 7